MEDKETSCNKDKFKKVQNTSGNEDEFVKAKKILARTKKFLANLDAEKKNKANIKKNKDKPPFYGKSSFQWALDDIWRPILKKKNKPKEKKKSEHQIIKENNIEADKKLNKKQRKINRKRTRLANLLWLPRENATEREKEKWKAEL